jgi:hypothetical protein
VDGGALGLGSVNRDRALVCLEQRATRRGSRTVWAAVPARRTPVASAGRLLARPRLAGTGVPRHPGVLPVGASKTSPKATIAADAYTIRCMPGLYEVEIEPEVRSWLASLSDRDFGRADFLVGLLAQRRRP